MPCNTPQGEIEWFEKKYGTNSPDKLRDMLCRVLTEIFNKHPNVCVDEDIIDWYSKHKE